PHACARQSSSLSFSIFLAKTLPEKIPSSILTIFTLFVFPLLLRILSPLPPIITIITTHFEDEVSVVQQDDGDVLCRCPFDEHHVLRKNHFTSHILKCKSVFSDWTLRLLLLIGFCFPGKSRTVHLLPVQHPPLLSERQAERASQSL